MDIKSIIRKQKIEKVLGVLILCLYERDLLEKLKFLIDENNYRIINDKIEYDMNIIQVAMENIFPCIAKTRI